MDKTQLIAELTAIKEQIEKLLLSVSASDDSSSAGEKADESSEEEKE